MQATAGQFPGLLCQRFKSATVENHWRAYEYRQARSETAQSTEAKPQMPTNSPLCTMPAVCHAAASACRRTTLY